MFTIDPTITEPRDSEARNNAIRRQQETSVFLIKFDLSKTRMPSGAKLVDAFLEFSVWDPSSSGKTKLVALPLETDWDRQATWRQPAPGKKWKGVTEFALTKDCGAPAGEVIVEPDAGADIADPPIAYRINMTNQVRAWLKDPAANRGVGLAPQSDRSIDDGQYTRFQVYASEANQDNVRPRLVLKFAAN